MSNSKRALMPLLIILMLVLQLMSPIAVFADGETPPDPPATEETPPTEDNVTVEEPAAEVTSSPEGDEVIETPPAEETSPVEEPAATEEAPASDPTDIPAPEPEIESSLPEEDLSIAEVLEQAPAETEIVVVNEEGEIEPLVTEAAAEIAAVADPIWCPNGQSPTPGTNGCTSTYASLQDLLTYLDANEQAQAGTIWIEDNYDSSLNDPAISGFVIDGGSFTTMKDYDLTIQGGWNGTSGSTNISGASTFTGDYLHVTNWNANVTLMDIIVNGAANNGIQIQTTGDIHLDGITSNANDLDGANLLASGEVSVSNSQFTGNDGSGIRIGNALSPVSPEPSNAALRQYPSLPLSGSITLNQVTANGNGLDGADLLSYGDIDVANSQFIGNDSFGIYASNYLIGFNAPEPSGAAPVPGALLPSSGNITLNQVTANENGLDGADLFSNGDIYVSNSQFKGNDGVGLFAGNFWFGIPGSELSNAAPFTNGVLPSSGNVTLSQVTANENGLDGAVLLSTGDIKVFSSQFNGNDGFGLYAGNFFFNTAPPQLSNTAPRQYPPLPFSGNITLSHVTANANGLGGAILESTEDINVFNGQFNGNGADSVPFCEGGECEYYPTDGGIGLAAASWAGTGQIKLDNVQASNNYGDGAWLEGDDIVVLNSAFHYNGQGLPYLGGNDLYADGLYINHLFGSSAYLECVHADGNAAYGIDIYTGDITLNHTTAYGNGWDDFYLESDTLNILNGRCREPITTTTSDLPWQIAPVTGIENIELNCSAYVGTVLVLPNGDEIRLPCPTIGDANLDSVPDNDLPGSLPGGNSYVSSFTAQVVQGGVSLGSLPVPMIVSFVIPDDMLDADLAILYWNGSEWVEVTSGYKTADGRFEASVNFTGTFILVSK